MQGDLFRAEAPVKRGKWPSEQLAELLGGHVRWDKVDPSIRSWASFHIFTAARQICAMPDKDKRKAALGKIPGPLRDRVKAEVERLWPMMRN